MKVYTYSTVLTHYDPIKYLFFFHKEEAVDSCRAYCEKLAKTPIMDTVHHEKEVTIQELTLMSLPKADLVLAALNRRGFVKSSVNVDTIKIPWPRS